jgi:hypothetical protein
VTSNGSKYVVAIFAILAAYFAYQWWFNENRIVKRRLGEVAATLSAPEGETQVGRLARLATLRRFLDERGHVTVGRTQYSRDEAIRAAAAWQLPPGGWNLDFADVDVRINADDSARAFVTAEMTTRDVQTSQPQSLGTVEVTFSLAKKSGDWLITDADVKRPETTR